MELLKDQLVVFLERVESAHKLIPRLLIQLLTFAQRVFVETVAAGKKLCVEFRKPRAATAKISVPSRQLPESKLLTATDLASLPLSGTTIDEDNALVQVPALATAALLPTTTSKLLNVRTQSGETFAEDFDDLLELCRQTTQEFSIATGIVTSAGHDEQVSGRS